MPEPLPPQLSKPSPHLRRAVWCIYATWAMCCVGVVVAIVTHDLSVAIWAFLAAGNAAGWLMATRAWEEWRGVAIDLMGLLERLRG